MEEYHHSYDFYLLIPFYNNLPGLIRSLISICYDPVKYALLIVDDGSKEPLQRSDLRPHTPPALDIQIMVTALRKIKGIVKALNYGTGMAGRKVTTIRYVARLDCGDLCCSKAGSRKQVSFLHLHQDTDLVGSWCIFRRFFHRLLLTRSYYPDGA